MLETNPFPFANEFGPQDGSAGQIKRICDFLAALAALVVASPILALAALFIRLTMGSPILFRQERPGYRERNFVCYKFRTMSEARDANGKLLPDESRLTGVGKIIRKLSIDELPQLWNVLKGDLSLVGPRPLLIRYLDRYEPEQRRRHLVKPGITGWAQVNGRNTLTWEQKFSYDVYYVDHWSFWFDIKIAAFTIVTVLRREGISQPGRATMDEFTGKSGKGGQKERPDHG